MLLATSMVQLRSGPKEAFHDTTINSHHTAVQPSVELGSLHRKLLAKSKGYPMTPKSIHIEGLTHRSPIPAASRVGPLISSSVIVGLDPETGSLPSTIDEQAENIFSHVGAILDATGMGWANILEMTFAMTDLENREVIGPLWLEHFPDEESRPARETQQRTRLPAGAQITARFTAYDSPTPDRRDG